MSFGAKSVCKSRTMSPIEFQKDYQSIHSEKEAYHSSSVSSFNSVETSPSRRFKNQSESECDLRLNLRWNWMICSRELLLHDTDIWCYTQLGIKTQISWASSFVHSS